MQGSIDKPEQIAKEIAEGFLVSNIWLCSNESKDVHSNMPYLMTHIGTFGCFYVFHPYQGAWMVSFFLYNFKCLTWVLFRWGIKAYILLITRSIHFF